MSYGKDPDLLVRGVGAIAARDAGNLRRARARAKALARLNQRDVKRSGLTWHPYGGMAGRQGLGRISTGTGVGPPGTIPTAGSGAVEGNTSGGLFGGGRGGGGPGGGPTPPPPGGVDQGGGYALPGGSPFQPTRPTQPVLPGGGTGPGPTTVTPGGGGFYSGGFTDPGPGGGAPVPGGGGGGGPTDGGGAGFVSGGGGGGGGGVGGWTTTTYVCGDGSRVSDPSLCPVPADTAPVPDLPPPSGSSNLWKIAAGIGILYLLFKDDE